MRAFIAVALALAVASCATRDDRMAFVAPPAEPPSNLACAPALGANDSDGDLARVDAALLSELCVSVAQVSDIGRTWVIQRYQYQAGSPGPLWVVPHDDEDSAFASGVAALRRHGGILVAVDNNGARTNQFRDPNRIFGAAGRCHGAGSGPVAPLFTQEMLRHRFAGYPIIALHSNLRGYEGDGADGQGNTSIRLGGRHRTPFPAAAPYPGSASPTDTLVFVAGPRRRPDEATVLLIAQLNAASINVMYEHAAPAWTDCSLSNFTLFANLVPYLNIETVEGDTETQARLIDELMRVLLPAVG